MFPFISNLFSIIRQVPAIISIVKAIIDIVGSDATKNILEAVRDAVTKTAPDGKIDTLPQPERKRLIKRLLPRVGQRLLGITDSQLETAMRAFGRGVEDDGQQTAFV